ncbi:hypothetical protein XENTR_v10016890 [Xenopus tropicalis]|nr:hypothetical protein XENTR_v10016890 [Xenopus tropicalis]
MLSCLAGHTNHFGALYLVLSINCTFFPGRDKASQMSGIPCVSDSYIGHCQERPKGEEKWLHFFPRECEWAHGLLNAYKMLCGLFVCFSSKIRITCSCTKHKIP